MGKPWLHECVCGTRPVLGVDAKTGLFVPKYVVECPKCGLRLNLHDKAEDAANEWNIRMIRAMR